MGPSEALCLLTQNNLQQLTNVSKSSSVNQCPYARVSIRFSAIYRFESKRDFVNQRDFVHPHPINLMPFDVKHVQFVVFCRKASLCNAHALSLFSQHSFSRLSTF